MKNVIINCSWGLDFDLYSEHGVEVFVDFYSFRPRQNNKIKRILIIIEPPEIIHNYTKMAINAQKQVDYIFTHNQDILDNCDNAILFEFGTSWIKETYKIPEKMFEVSTLVGGKLMAQGHHLRQQLWYKENDIKIPKKFFISGNMSSGLKNQNNNSVLGKSKEPLFDSQFHIVIENTKRKNWFTEKIIDSLNTKTIPIYYGCPNIGDYFDIRGMFIVNSVQEIINVCNSLTEDSYKEKLKYVEKNYLLSKKFIKIDDRIKEKIKELI